MAEKQDGYVAQKRDNEAGHIYFYQDKEHCEHLIAAHRRKLLKATLVISDERVFTESEVMAMMRTITHCTGSPLASIHINEVRRVFAEEHGIVLDPA